MAMSIVVVSADAADSRSSASVISGATSRSSSTAWLGARIVIAVWLGSGLWIPTRAIVRSTPM